VKPEVAGKPHLAIGTLVERVSRYVILIHLPSVWKHQVNGCQMWAHLGVGGKGWTSSGSCLTPPRPIKSEFGVGLVALSEAGGQTLSRRWRAGRH
jgi:hypothetical protein